MSKLTGARMITEALSRLTGRRDKGKHIWHFDARTVDEVVSVLGESGDEARAIAGGVDLVSLMNKRVMTPRVLVNIKTIPGLRYVSGDSLGVRIGALTTISELEKSGIIRESYPMLAEAARSVGAPQIRNMATIGGNLCQEVRCWYYRRSPLTGRTFFCLRKGGEHCYAVAGENAYHAILGGNGCHAVCPSDLAPALVALDAKLKTAGRDGERVVRLEDFYTTLGNTLAPDEIITEIQIPAPGAGVRQRFLKFRIRKAIDFAISSVAAAITLRSGVVSDARIVLGGVAPVPYRAFGAEESLKGAALTATSAAAAAGAAVSAAVPLSGNAYKVAITRALVRRAIAE